MTDTHETCQVCYGNKEHYPGSVYTTDNCPLCKTQRAHMPAADSEAVAAIIAALPQANKGD